MRSAALATMRLQLAEVMSLKHCLEAHPNTRPHHAIPASLCSRAAVAAGGLRPTPYCAVPLYRRNWTLTLYRYTAQGGIDMARAPHTWSAPYSSSAVSTNTTATRLMPGSYQVCCRADHHPLLYRVLYCCTVLQRCAVQ